MADQGNWVSLVRAVEAVHAVTGGAPGAVYQTLIAICAEGLVRAEWTAHFSRTRPPIRKRDWIGADIDWSVRSGRIVKADGNGMAGVDFSEDDLKCWAAARAPAAAPEHPAPLSKEATLIDAAADPDPPASPRDTTEEACRKLIVSLDSSGLTKHAILQKARNAIPDLQLVEFKRAWFNGANLLKKPGRRN
jgi:hypothetical protein